LGFLFTGTLTIKHTQERDHGKYECVAQNEVGVAYSSAAMLYVKGKAGENVTSLIG
jgi:netrin-G3 ligand